MVLGEVGGSVIPFQLAASLVAFLVLAFPALAEPVPTIGPPPGWVRSATIPAPDIAKKDIPVQVLLSSLQHYIAAESVELHVRTVAVPQTTAGLQSVGNIIIPWNSERSDLTVHHAKIRRGADELDLLKDQQLTVLRRENNLENSTLDGVRTVVLQAAGLQIGDQLDISFTYRERAGTIGMKPEAILLQVDQAPYGLMERRFLIAQGAKVEWRSDPTLGQMPATKRGGLTEISLVRPNFTPTKQADFAPLRHSLPAIQFTSYANWSEVAAVMEPLFSKARKPDASSPLLAMADDIAKAHVTPEARMQAALRLTQEKVRYVALTLGEGAFVPATADQTWTRRFGDCKGKAAMLLALLDRLGITAEPLLTSSEMSSLLGGRLPSLYAFDHVVVRARISDRYYVLDPTNYGQRTLEELSNPAFEWGLPTTTGSQLWQIPRALPSRPLKESEIVWDASKGFDQQVPFTATLTYRGRTASLVRALQAAAPDRSALEKYLKDEMPGIKSEQLQMAGIEPEGSQGDFTVRFQGKAVMDWDRNIAGRRYWFDHSVPSWKVDFKRSEGPLSDTPVALNIPVWERSSETVILPLSGNGFRTTGSAINTTVAGTEIKRSIRLESGRATAVADFRRLQGEITAQEARTAKPVLDRIAKDHAYIVAPKDYVVSNAEVKAILKEDAEGYDGYVERARLLMDQSDRRQAITELERAIKIDPARAEAPALRSINYFFLDRFEEARAAAKQAIAIDPDDVDVLRAQALVAWYDRDDGLALKAINRAIELDSDYHGLYSIRARFRAGLGQYDDALVDVRRAVDLSADTMSPAAIARYEAASGRIDQALTTIEKAIASGRKDDPYLFVLKGDVLALQGKGDGAKAAYRSAKEEMRAYMDKQRKAAAGPGAAPVESDFELDLLVSTRNFDEAEPIAERRVAGQRYPSAVNLAKRAYVRVMNGKYDGAIADARNALALDPSDGISQMALVLAYLRTGKFAEAERQATRALAIGRNASHLFARAIARARLGNTNGASEDLKSAQQMQFDIILEPAFFGLKAI